MKHTRTSHIASTRQIACLRRDAWRSLSQITTAEKLPHTKTITYIHDTRRLHANKLPTPFFFRLYDPKRLSAFDGSSIMNTGLICVWLFVTHSHSHSFSRSLRAMGVPLTKHRTQPPIILCPQSHHNRPSLFFLDANFFHECARTTRTHAGTFLLGFLAMITKTDINSNPIYLIASASCAH